MRQIAEENRLPAEVDAQPPVRAAAALRSVIRGHRDEIEREQRLPKALSRNFIPPASTAWSSRVNWAASRPTR